MSYIVWDVRLINTYKTGSRQELISKLNSVDLVIMDGKESSRITSFLGNQMQLIYLEDELRSLSKLLNVVGSDSFIETLDQQVNIYKEQFKKIRHDLYYLIEKNKDPVI